MTTYITCFECEYSFATPEELVEKHVAVLRDMGIDPEPADLNPRKIHICPECSHDF